MKNKFLKTTLVAICALAVAGCGTNSSNFISSSSVTISTSKEQVEGKVLILFKYETLSIGSDDITLQAAVDPSSLSQEVIWSSSDTSVATVDNGVLSVKGLGTTIVTATSVVNSDWKDSFELTVTGAVISGTVKDIEGNLIEGAKVEYGKNKVTTDAKGEYKLVLESSKEESDLVVSKEGYRTQTIDIDVKEGKQIKNVILVPTEGEISLTLNGSVANVLDGNLEGAKVKVNGVEAISNSEGLFSFNSVAIGGTFNVSCEKDGYVSFERSYDLETYISQLENGTKSIDLGIFDLYSYQDDINIYSSGNKHVSGHIYRTLEGVKFTYDANFDITESGFFYELFLDFGNSSPSDFNRSDSNDMDFKIDSTGIISENKYNDTFGEGEKEFNYIKNGDNHYIEVTFPYSYLKMESNTIFGFNVITHTDSVSDRSMNLFGNQVEWYNYFTYPRVDVDNTIYQSNINGSAFDLNSKSVVKSVELGTVGVTSEYQYKISVARDDYGLYIIADEVNDTHAYVKDGTFYHFFIDTAQEDFDRNTDSKVAHFAVEAGRWVKKYTVEHKDSVFNNEKGLLDLINEGLVLESIKGVTTLYIPYAMLGNGFNRDSTLGIAANIEEGAGNWKTWQAPYISGYTNEPHVEEIKSFVRLSKDLEVIPTV